MFNGKVPVVLALKGLQHDPEDTGKKDDIKFSDEGTHLKIKRITDILPVSVIINKCSQTSTHSSKPPGFYYEAQMTTSSNSIAIGLMGEGVVHDYVYDISHHGPHPEWNLLIISHWPNCHSSFAYYGSCGKVGNARYHTSTKYYQQPLKINDVVGCGIDEKKEEIFFTVNGEKLEPRFNERLGFFRVRWFPIIGFKEEGSEVEINFGGNPFVYQPKKISTKMFPKPETFSDEWTKHINSRFEQSDDIGYDHLKDVIIISKDGKEIRCHGLILSIRSSVFQSALRPTNNGANTVNIKDFNAETIQKMLRFIYSDTVEEEDIDMELLGIANMYQIEALQIICEKRLCHELDVDNVLDAWIGANFFGRQNFQKICESFATSHWMEIQKTESFSRLFREKCEAIGTLMVKMLNMQTSAKKDPESISECSSVSSFSSCSEI